VNAGVRGEGDDVARRWIARRASKGTARGLHLSKKGRAAGGEVAGVVKAVSRDWSFVFVIVLEKVNA